jgi:type IV pilus assembly protein PilC
MLQGKELDVIALIGEEKKSINMDVDKYFTYLGIFDHASLKDITNFSKQMSALLDAGVSVVKALQLLAEDNSRPIMKTTLDQVILDVKAGKAISVAFSKHKNVFSDFYVNLVRSGEESGKMSMAFSHLAEYSDRNYSLVVKVRNAMIYPAFVISVFVFVMVVVFTFVIPKLSGILQDSGVELPALTKVVLSISNFLVNYGIYMGVFLVGLCLYVFVTMRGTKSWTSFFDTMKIKIPILRDVFKMLYVTRIADNIQTLLTSGVSLTKAIQITGDVVGNMYYKEILDQALIDVRGGKTFSSAFAKHPDLIPNTLVQMVKIGEETGEIGKLMGNIAKFYEREINTTIDTLVGLVEPIMIVVLGLGVGTLLISVLMPIYSLASSF